MSTYNQPGHSDEGLKIGVVGVCGSGKSTLIVGLEKHGFFARHIAQEHSFVPDMWELITNPDVLIFLMVSYPNTMVRKKFRWEKSEYEQQIFRLRHAHQNADFHLGTDELTNNQVLEKVLGFIEGEKP